MPDIIQPFKDEESFLPDYASFILRCWTNRQGQVRARLIDVHSGVSHPVASLAALPELVHRLVAKDLPSPSPEDTGQT